MEEIFIYLWAFVALLIFIFLAIFAKNFSTTDLELDLAGKRFRIRTSQTKKGEKAVLGLDPGQHYIDSKNGFAFHKLSSQKWTGPQYLVGIDEKFEANKIILSPELETQRQLHDEFHPLGKLRREVEIIRYEAGDSIEIAITEETTTDVFENALRNLRAFTEGRGEQLDPAQILQWRRETMGFQSGRFSNEFVIYILNKDKLSGLPIKLNNAILLGAQVSGEFLFLKNILEKNNTLACVLDFKLSNVLIEGKVEDFNVSRLYYYVEGRRAFLVVGVAYSPQTKEPVSTWEELKAAVDFFTVID